MCDLVQAYNPLGQAEHRHRRGHLDPYMGTAEGLYQQGLYLLIYKRAL